MEQDLYISCVKINGVPILPPLMTENIREEMNYYKQLAIAVEERIKSLQISKQLTSKSKATEREEKFQLEAEKSTENNDIFLVTQNTDTELDTTQEDSVYSKLCKMSSDEDCQTKKNLNDSVSSDAITTSTDLNQYLNESAMSTKTTTGETTPEFWKPQVPKTLNIIPITLERHLSENLISITNMNEDVTKSNETIPKMVRQGSYVLDTPSPILLAHLQTELNTAEYIPTPSKTCGQKRKGWNLAQVKPKWERPVKNTSPCTADCEKSKPKIRPRRYSASNVQNYKINKFVPRGKTFGLQHSAKSVDSIHTILTKSYESKLSTRSNTPINGEKVNKSISILASADQFGGSLGSLNKTDDQSLEKLSDDNKCGDSNQPSNNSVVSPKKVMIFFQEIQEMQKRQMLELLEKQQQEQLKMQEEFKRQQSVLMQQIKKAFPGSVLPFEENQSIFTENLDNRVQCDKDNNVERCLLDYVYPIDRNLGRDGNDNFNSRMTRSLDSERMFQRDDFNFYNEQLIETLSIDNSYSRDDIFNDRHGNVNRRLFPFGSKTTKVPVLNNSLYEHKHHRAATVINAYARGYLVRRIMKTEQVIDLKNIYKEALHCLLELHVDAPLSLSELNFHRRLQLQLDAASSNIVDLFAQDIENKMKVIAHDRELKKSRTERPNSSRSYSFATQRTLARKKMKEMGESYPPFSCTSKPSNAIRARCQTWTSNTKDKRPLNIISQGIKRSTSAGAVRKPWR